MKRLARPITAVACTLMLSGPAQALVCAAPDADAASIALASTPVTGTVGICDLHGSFNADRFPRYFQILNRGLAQDEDSETFFDTALGMAEQLVIKRRFERAGTLYEILLAHHPREPRALSSYAAVNMMQQRLQPAAELVYRAFEIDPGDPLIQSNAFAIAVLNGDHAKAREINRLQVERAAGDARHLLRQALIASGFAPGDAATSWNALVAAAQSEDGKAYWTYLQGALERFDAEELVTVANALIDASYVYEAVILLDLVAARTDNLSAYYMKAKALETAQHYRLALAAAERTRQIFLQRSEYDPEFYRNLLYNLARLAYAARDYHRSLALLDEFESREFVHAQLDYLYAVNYTALGMPREARRHLQKCAQWDLAEELKNYCIDVLARDLPELPQSPPDGDDNAIEISPSTPGPDLFLAGAVEELGVRWLGRIESREFRDTADGISIAWIAEFVQPSRNYQIEDNRQYDVEITSTDRTQWFRVELQLQAASDEEKKAIREQFAQEESFILVDGTAKGAIPLAQRLAARVKMHSAILTSSLNLVDTASN